MIVTTIMGCQYLFILILTFEFGKGPIKIILATAYLRNSNITVLDHQIIMPPFEEVGVYYFAHISSVGRSVHP